MMRVQPVRHHILRKHLLVTVHVTREIVNLVFLKGLIFFIQVFICGRKLIMEAMESKWEVSFEIFRKWCRLYAR
jgi:hypothetical protein